MKKLQHIVLSFCLVLSLLFYPNVEASASSVSLGVSSSSINIGDTVTVSVSVPDGITAGVDLSFSSDVLSFVSASADVGANGSVVTINVGKLSLASSNTVSVTFKANTSGTASISANPTSAVDNSTAEEVSLSGASTSITVANQVPEQPSTPPPSDAPSGGDDTSDDEDDEDDAPKSADNSLSTLKLSAGTLSPSFKYNVTKYTATVGYDVENLVVSATPSNGKATIESVTGNGNVKLNVGENTIEIVVQAENGVKATYTIVVTRQEEGEDTPESPDDESSETESQDTPEAEEKESLQWNGQKLQPAENVPKDVVPEDFSVNTVMVNSVEMPCLTFENGDLKVLYLTNEEGKSGLYVYDEVQQMVYPFVKLESNDNYVVVLVPDAGNAPAPENYKACTLSIDGKGVINAYQFVQPVTDTEQTSWLGPETYYAAEPVATDFYLIYCMNNSGEKGWYVYDSVEGTIQRYLGSVHNPVVEPEVETDEITDTDKNSAFIGMGYYGSKTVYLDTVDQYGNEEFMSAFPDYETEDSTDSYGLHGIEATTLKNAMNIFINGGSFPSAIYNDSGYTWGSGTETKTYTAWSNNLKTKIKNEKVCIGNTEIMYDDNGIEIEFSADNGISYYYYFDNYIRLEKNKNISLNCKENALSKSLYQTYPLTIDEILLGGSYLKQNATLGYLSVSPYGYYNLPSGIIYEDISRQEIEEADGLIRPSLSLIPGIELANDSGDGTKNNPYRVSIS